MVATQTASHPTDGRQPDANPPTFESVWALMERVGERLDRVGEKQAETDRIVKENARQMEEYNKRFGDFTRRFGEMVDYMVAPNLLKKFKEYGLKFNEAMSNRVFSDDDDNALFEVDIFLQNSETAMLVEVKTKLTTEDVKEHVERLENMRAYANLHGNKCIFLGAVAGVVMTPHVKKYALGRGFFVIEPSGETFNITPPNGKPKEW
jgi:hypothetical protein